ncbi:MAG: M48 family metallopeptidase [Betaproteobacteria bacterium]|nr:M48 family metallopeptidase [Betaproteobacteria bacterium]
MAKPRSTPLTTQLELPFAPIAANPVVSNAAVLQGRAVPYILHRSPGRRRISLSIDERGLRVGAPPRASLREIESVLHAHASWVLRKLAFWDDRRAPVRRWESGEMVSYLGLPLQLAVAPGARRVALTGTHLQICSPNVATDAVSALAIHWLRGQALAHFLERIEHFRGRFTLEAVTVKLSNARSRWGSCHVSGRISLNWRLIHMPPHLIDYVVVHELAHLREMNHSPRFWAVVGGVIADYAARRREIRREAHRYLAD